MQNVICVFQLIDDLTGKLLKGDAYIFKITQGEGKLIRKEDGYFVWVGKESKTVCVTVQSTDYEVYQEMIYCDRLSKLNPIVTIRLLPHVQKALGIYQKVSGQIEVPNQQVFLIPKLQKSLLKYGGSNDKGEIQVQRLTNRTLEHFNFIILDDLESPLEVFEIEEYRPPYTFIINKQLQRQYAIHSEVVRVYGAVSDAIGKYTILVDDFYEFTSYYIAYIKENQLIKKSESRE